MFTAFLHSPEYKKHYAADLKKMLPHIPYAKTLKHFQAFAKAVAPWRTYTLTTKPCRNIR